MQTTTVTQKGQVTVPKKIREKLNIKPYDKVFIKEAKGYIKIFPTHDILELAGSLKPKKGKGALAARRKMQDTYRRI